MTNNQPLVETYAQALRVQLTSGHAHEHAYRPALERLMASFSDVIAVNDPKRSAHGNPDFVFLKQSNRNVIRGYAEAKNIIIDLEKVEKTDQLKRYAGYDNLFLTNYLDFRFYRNGERYQQVIIGELKGDAVRFFPERFDTLRGELERFLELPPESITSGNKLARIMGAKAQRIRANVSQYLSTPNERNEELEKIYRVMKELLVHDLTIEQFADMYAQTLVYGLFAARYHDKTPESFTRQEARELVPASNPFLAEFFDHIAGRRFDTRLAYIVDELCEVFSVSDVQAIVHHHLKLTEANFHEKDPIIHFYEDFLQAYDPVERKRMGAYYTPIPVVQFIVRMVDDVLKKDFGLLAGLADVSKRTIENKAQKSKTEFHRVQILDPAVGTATFLNEIIKHIYVSFTGQEGRWPSYVERELIPRLHGFELMMAPYTIAHLKLGLTLEESGVTEFQQRLGVYLTNTLEEGVNRAPDLFSSFGLAEAVSNEAVAASAIKHERPIMVVIGNPPYSGESSNKTDYAMSLVAKYKFEPDGTQKLQERNPKWVNDDYVKFIAFAEDMIANNGTGVVAMITNHGYLDNPTFRGMRWHLTQTFDAIYVLDLHGNSKKKETAPDGGKDENVFDIQQGVAIIVAVKTGKKRGTPAKVFHADLFGTRRHKFDELQGTPKWRTVTLDPKMHYFAQKSTVGKAEYDAGVKLNELFIITNVGIVTSADKVFIGHSKNEVMDNLEETKLQSSNGKAFERLQNHEIDPTAVMSVSYRPFDDRFIYYDPKIIERARENVMRHFLKDQNIGIVFRRQQLPERQTYYFVCNAMMVDGYIRSDNKGGETMAPLWLNRDDGTRTVNFQPEVLKQLTVNLIKTYEPEQILDYMYASLYSPNYRKKYAEFLKIDFPRVPVPASDDEFIRLVKLGTRLRELHLLTAPDLGNYDTTFSVAGSNTVDKVEYKNGNVWINSDQFFGNVPEVAWNFFIGGYQPAQKWLKDRKGRDLSSEGIDHYQKMIKALSETNQVIADIDART